MARTKVKCGDSNNDCSKSNGCHYCDGDSNNDSNIINKSSQNTDNNDDKSYHENSKTMLTSATKIKTAKTTIMIITNSNNPENNEIFQMKIYNKKRTNYMGSNPFFPNDFPQVHP